MEALYTFLGYFAGGAIIYIILVYLMFGRYLEWLRERLGMWSDVGPTERPFLKAFPFASVTYFVGAIWLSLGGRPVSSIADMLLIITLLPAFIAAAFVYLAPREFPIWGIGGIYLAILVLFTLPLL